MGIWAIGDVQGCFAELEQLLFEIDFNKNSDQVWFCGDLLGKGPDSEKVLELIQSLETSAIVVLGNHDLNFLALCHGGGERSKDDRLDTLLSSPKREQHCNWLRKQKIFHYDPELHMALVHAGVDWQWSLQDCRRLAHELEELLRSDSYATILPLCYGDQPLTWHESLSFLDRTRCLINVFTRLRCYNQQLQYELLYNKDEDAPGLIPWFQIPERKMIHTPIVFGHWSRLRQKKWHNAHNLDYSCVYGGELFALRLDEHATARVKCRR
ncbi:MAG: symmetrical bis(5'-nucleosyl)-tetraphosphatase [Methylacidiphilales bacterium]|nr:symmetrical bis(5'-nucleosyl)-tetraphosphatase [Candidatus Methylacidiphilales bacterium]